MKSSYLFYCIITIYFLLGGSCSIGMKVDSSETIIDINTPDKEIEEYYDNPFQPGPHSEGQELIYI